MRKVNPWGSWEKGPQHGWRAVDKQRTSQDGEVQVHVQASRSVYVLAVLLVAVCAGAWWWQTQLDGAAWVAVLVVAVLMSLYAATLAVWGLIGYLLSTFLRRF